MCAWPSHMLDQKEEVQPHPPANNLGVLLVRNAMAVGGYFTLSTGPPELQPTANRACQQVADQRTCNKDRVLCSVIAEHWHTLVFALGPGSDSPFNVTFYTAYCAS
jgi:hypothetical protein